jgi:hypothetical protein
MSMSSLSYERAASSDIGCGSCFRNSEAWVPVSCVCQVLQFGLDQLTTVGIEVIPPEPPVVVFLWPERRGARQGRAVFGAA